MTTPYIFTCYYCFHSEPRSVRASPAQPPWLQKIFNLAPSTAAREACWSRWPTITIMIIYHQCEDNVVSRFSHSHSLEGIGQGGHELISSSTGFVSKLPILQCMCAQVAIFRNHHQMQIVEGYSLLTPKKIKIHYIQKLCRESGFSHLRRAESLNQGMEGVGVRWANLQNKLFQDDFCIVQYP